MSLCVSSAFAANEIYIGKDNNTSNDVNSIAITQSGSANVNKIGTNGNDHFAVEGKWGSINITQTNGAALISAAGAQTLVGSPGDTNYVPERGANSSSGNSITGFIRNASTGSGNTTTLVQNGDGNSIALAIGADTKSTGAVVIGISQVGDRNSSTYNMNHSGNITVAETTSGSNNTVAVTSSGGVNYSNTINLNGSGNAVTVARSGSFTTNTDTISLTGDLNAVNLNGVATGTNTVALASTGNNNVFGITQNGAGSSAIINVAANYKNVTVSQLTAGSRLSLASTLTNGGNISITQ